MAGLSLRGVPKTRRITRAPSHSWYVRQQPYAIEPFCIAPVLPGETMKSLRFQARAVSDPLVNPLCGWHLEYYWFYVKHRDLSQQPEFEAMVLNPSWNPATVVTAQGGAGRVSPQYFSGGTGYINWQKFCLEAVVNEYFRDDGKTIADYTLTLDGITKPLAARVGNDWLDSAVQAADRTAIDVEVEGSDVNTTIQASEIESSMRQWEFLKLNSLTTMTYEDWLASYGVRVTTVQENKPELIRYVREWTYPTNTIDPTSGVPRSAVSWAVGERADKDRFFKEPGFIFGVTVARPKVYISRVKGAAVAIMRNVFTWLPAVLRGDPAASLTLLPDEATGLFPGSTDTGGYWVDVRDLLLYGDQFINFNHDADATFPTLTIPSDDLRNRRFATSEAMLNALFVDAAGGKKFIRQDGRADFTILGSEIDHTPGAVFSV